MTTPDSIPETPPIWRRELSHLVSELIAEGQTFAIKAEDATLVGSPPAIVAQFRGSADAMKVAAYRLSLLPGRVAAAERAEEARSGH